VTLTDYVKHLPEDSADRSPSESEWTASLLVTLLLLAHVWYCCWCWHGASQYWNIMILGAYCVVMPELNWQVWLNWLQGSCH